MAGRWRRFVLRPFVWLLALAAVAVLALILFVESRFARERLRELIEARASDALEREVRIADVDFELVPPTVVVLGLEIASDRPDEPPLARLARGEVHARLGGLSLAVVRLARVELEGLELALEFRDDGSDNLPRPRGGGGKRRVELEIDGLAIDGAAIRIEEQRLPFALAAEAVRVRLAGVGDGRLDGRAVAQAVRLELPEAAPLEVAVAARVRLESDRLRIHHARIDAPDLSVVARGEVGWRGGTRVELATRLESSGALLDRLGWAPGLVAGGFAFDGEFAWRDRTWTAVGRLAAARVAVAEFELEQLAGRVIADAERARIDVERARWAGGDVAGSFTTAIARPYAAELDLTVDGAALEGVLARFEVPLRDVRGRISGPFSYRFELLDAERGEGEGAFRITGAEIAGIPRARGEVGLELDDGRVTLAPIVWQASGQTVRGDGFYDLAAERGRFDLQVASEDLGRLARLLPFLEPGELWLPTAGTGELAVELDLVAGDFRAAVAVEAAALETPGIAAARAAGRFVATGERLTIERLILARAAGGRVELAGSVPFEGDLALALEIFDWPIEEARPWLPFELPLAGPARGTVTLGGTAETLTGSADLVVGPVELGGLEAKRLAVELAWDAERLRVAEARLDLEAGGLVGRGALRFADGALAFDVDSPSLALSRAPFATAGEGALAGSLVVEARIGGTLEQPAIELEATAREATLAGRELPGDDDVRLRLDWHAGDAEAELRIAEVARLVGGGRLELDGTIGMRFTLETGRLSDLVTLAAGGELLALDGGLEAELTVDRPPGGAVAAELRAPQLAFHWQGRPIRSLEPVVASYRDGRLRLDSLYLALGESGDEVFVGGRVELGREPVLHLNVQADFAADWLRPWLGEVGDLDVGGRVALLAGLSGPLEQAAWSGQGEWTDGRFIPPSLPQTLEQARALVLLYPGFVVLDELTAELGGGAVTAAGRVDFRPAGVHYRFEAAARGVSLRWPPGWQLRGDADLTLASTAAGRQLAGQVTLDRAYYVQDIELSPAQLVQRLLTRSRLVVPETDEALASTALNVGVIAPGTVRVRNNLAELDATAELAVRGSLARPVVFGEVRTAAGGEVDYGGNTYTVERAVLTFANPARIDPYLDLVATTRVADYAVTLNIGGALSRPQTSFRSDPPLPDLEVLGLITTGAPIEQPIFTDVAGTATSTSASGAAEALLYGQAASLVSTRVGRLFGFDRVRVEPLTTGDTVAEARVTVGKRLSSGLFVTYSYDPASTAQDVIQVEWQLSDRLQLVLTQNGDESYAVDARWEKRF